MKQAKIFILFFILGFIFTSCNQPIGLGPSLNLEPPVTVIISPVFLENIKNSVTIIGTATDLEEIVTINVALENTVKDSNYWKIEWQGNNGIWQTRETKGYGNSPGQWKGFSGADWTGVDHVEWAINDIPMDEADEGEYIISAGSINKVKNEGTYAQQRVVIDKTPPVVEIILPALDTGDYTTVIVPAFDQYKLKDLTVLDKLHNTSIRVQYQVEDDFSINNIKFELANNSGTVYYTKNIDSGASFGTFIIDAAEISTTDKTYMQIISTAADNAENEKITSHGWFVWWPDAAKPWSQGLGDREDKPEAQLPRVYMGNQVYGQAYDNRGVAGISYGIFNAANTAISSGSSANTPLQGQDTPSKFFNFNITAPTVPGKYKVVVTTTNINGLTGEDTFWFFVYQPVVKGPLLQSISGTSAGIYGLGSTIEIIINLREAVNITAPVLTLNVANGGTPTVNAVFDASSNNTANLKFTYPIKPGDSAQELRITNFTYSNLTASPSGALDEPNTIIIPDQGLSYYGMVIEISTDAPVLQGAPVYENGRIILTYSKPIFKGTGRITLTLNPTTNYRAPAVLTASEYRALGGNSILGTWYTVGTNGANLEGGFYVADTTEKYILNYNTEPTNTALVSALQAQKAHMVEIPVVAPDITIGGTGGNAGRQLIIDLKDYAPSVKGVSYAITYPLGLIRDNMGNAAAAITGTATTFAYPGVNPPFIRVQRFEDSFDSQSVTLPAVTVPPEYGPPTPVWVRNADMVISNTVPVTPGDWHRAEVFTINFPFNTATSNLYEATAQFRLDLKEIKSNGGVVQGHVYRNTTSQYAMSWWLDGVWTQIFDTNNLGNYAGTVYINPYENTILPSRLNSPQEGDITVNNLWVNLDTTNIETSDTSPAGIGWIIVNRAEIINPGGSVPQANTTTARAVQRFRTNFRIDCQTPDATLTRNNLTGTSLIDTPPVTGNTAGTQFNNTHTIPRIATMTAAGTGYTSGNIEIGPVAANDTTDRNGYLYGIRARAVNGSYSEETFELAARSVIQYTDFNATGLVGTLRNYGNTSNPRQVLQMWLRGGDGISGSNLTPGFPLSWGGEGGIRLMSTDTPADLMNANVWYWITWNVNATAYFRFIAGTTITPYSLPDVQQGPKQWSMGKNRWTFQYDKFGLHPGGSISMNRQTFVQGQATMDFEFFDNFSGSR